MRQNKLFAIIMIFFLFISIVHAIGEENNQEEFDFVDGDYATITDWLAVDWTKIPPDRIIDVPADKLDYSKIKGVQRLQMNVEQITANLENINNLAGDVDPQKAIEAIKNQKSVDIASLGSNAKIVGNSLVTDKGNFDFEGKTGWAINVESDGKISIVAPTKISQGLISSQDNFEVNEHIDFNTDDGRILNIKGIDFKNGKIFVHEGESANIGDYVVSGKDTQIFFDNTKKENSNYVSLFDGGLNIGSAPDSNEPVIVEPKPGNMLFNMVKRDYSTDPPTLVPSERDSMTMKVSGGDSLEVESRADDGLTPLMKHSGNGRTDINTGRMGIIFNRGEMDIKPPKPFVFNEAESIMGDASLTDDELKNSVAFEIISNNNDLNDMIIRTSSSNRFMILDEFNHEIFKNNAGLKVSNRLDDNMMKTITDLQNKHKDIKFSISTMESIKHTEVTANLVQVVDEWLDGKEGIQVRVFSFNTKDNAAGRGDGTIFLGERAFDPSTFLSINRRNNDNVFKIIDHEFYHVLSLGLHKKEIKSEDMIKDERLFIKYKDVADNLINELFQDNNFIEVIDEVMLKSNDFDRGLINNNLKEKDIRSLINLLKTNDNINSLKIENIVNNKYGYNSYAFTKMDMDTNPIDDKSSDGEDEFIEMVTVYAELPPSKASKNKDLAQLNYDMVMSTNPPDWLRERETKRYYSIMNYNNPTYCDDNLCGPCLIYKLTCDD